MDKPIVHPNFAQPSSKNASPSPTSPTASATTQPPHGKTSTSTIQYDHETYLELLAGESNSVEKTASQVYEEVCLFPSPTLSTADDLVCWLIGIGTSKGTKPKSAESGCVVGAAGVGC